MHRPANLDLTFPGFTSEAFEALARLRAIPTIEQYRSEKTTLDIHVMQPFKAFRDDLVVNFVLPNHITLETERNVFSRLLKNDFGAGGANSRVWMAFYRPGRTRLTDFQPFHGVYPDGFHSGLHVGGRDRKLVRIARDLWLSNPSAYLAEFNRCMAAGLTLDVSVNSSDGTKRFSYTGHLAELPEPLARARSVSLVRSFSRDCVMRLGPTLVGEAIETMMVIWPVYQMLVGDGVPE